MIRRVRYYIFLRDVIILALTSFGGPQAHFSMILDRFVKKRGYLNEDDLVELYALCQIIPGPTSTQTIIATGFKIGGPNLAYLTLLVWMLPAVIVMTAAAIFVTNFQAKNDSLEFTRFIQPMAVGFVSFAAYYLIRKVIHSKTSWAIMVLAALLSFSVRKPYIFPILIIMGGAISAFKFKKQPVAEKTGLSIQWSNFFLWIGVLILAAGLGGITRAMPVRLFENFYRNGSLIFGGSQVLIPYLYTEFVVFKKYLSSSEFLSGFSIVQALPGPVFSFSSYIGALAMKDHGFWYQVLGGFVAAAGIFLPGTFLIFFVTRFWDGLKKYRIVRASLEGVNASSCGMIAAAAFLLALPLDPNLLNFSVTAVTFLMLISNRIPAPFIIIAGLIAGIFL